LLTIGFVLSIAASIAAWAYYVTNSILLALLVYMVSGSLILKLLATVAYLTNGPQDAKLSEPYSLSNQIAPIDLS
jgi:hypothetical protein